LMVACFWLIIPTSHHGALWRSKKYLH
jgi:hypothetical protein